MTFKQLRNQLVARGPQAIRWIASGIVEYAEVTETGAVRVTNLISKKSYVLPRYDDFKLEIVAANESMRFGLLLPKNW